MPQLMPMNWIFSSVILLMILVSASIIFSESVNKIYMKNMSGKVDELKILWCW